MEKLNTMLPELDHYLLHLTKQCLHNEPTKRPSSTEVLEWLQKIDALERKDFDDPYIEFGTTLAGESKEVRMTGSLRFMEADINRRSLGVDDPESVYEVHKT